MPYKFNPFTGNLDRVGLPLSGGTMTGSIEMDANNVSDINKLSFNNGSTFVTEFNDTDNFSDASGSAAASSESIKNYVDATHYVTYTTDNRPNTSLARFITWDKGGRATASLTYSSMKAEIIMPFAGTVISLTIYTDYNTPADWGSTVAQIHKNRATQAPAGNVTVDVGHQSTELFTFFNGNTFDIGDRIAIGLTPTSTMQYFVASLLVKFEV